MYDNKIRLSDDVLQKAEVIAAEWGLKNVRAAVEAVFRKYADDYLYGRLGQQQNQGLTCPPPTPPSLAVVPLAHSGTKPHFSQTPPALKALPTAPPQAININHGTPSCEAIDALDDLLAL